MKNVFLIYIQVYLEAQNLMLLRVFAMQAVISSSMGYKASFKYTGIKCNVFVVFADETRRTTMQSIRMHALRKKRDCSLTVWNRLSGILRAISCHWVLKGNLIHLGVGFCDGVVP